MAWTLHGLLKFLMEVSQVSRMVLSSYNGGARSDRGRVISAAIVLLATLGLAQQEARAVPIEAPACSDEMGLTCVQPGNDAGVGGESNVEMGIFDATTVMVDIMAVTADVTSAPADFTFDPDPINNGNTFDWTYVGAEILAYATLKAGNEFAIFDIGGATMGTLTTVDILLNGGGQIPDISHVRFWKLAGSSVPEPVTSALLVAGLAGLGFFSRRRSNAT